MNLQTKNRLFISIVTICILLSGCAWQQNPTPATLDSSISNQDAQNLILHSVSSALGSQLLFRGNIFNDYVVVYALTLKTKTPTAVSIFSTPKTNPYFVSLIASSNISAYLFAPRNNKIIHSDTTIADVPYSDITNSAAKTYLNSLGFNEKNHFLKRTTYFYKDNETLKLVDYILPDKKTDEIMD